ncbi:hypothetical protein [Actinomadura welshii]|uniref:hypothetical protein n=1 Tax=Actinomadura welshii TaxID=3103817 RepID=UPI001269332A|nr:hypothetical protein [Actinomadura madurae]
MTAHSSILPGHGEVGRVPICRGDRCNHPITKPLDGDTPERWELALRGGVAAIRKYLDDFNGVQRHGAICEYRELPPSILLACNKKKEESKALDDALEALRTARNEPR